MTFVIRPSDVYKSKEVVEGAISGRRITGFRFPLVGEKYVSTGNSLVVARYSNQLETAGPRFIVADETPKSLDASWE